MRISKAVRLTFVRLLTGGTLVTVPLLAFAGNGLNDLGFGAQSLGMAGADLALARDTAALNINPAGLTQIRGSAFDVYIEPYVEPSSQHKDELGNSFFPIRLTPIPAENPPFMGFGSTAKVARQSTAS